MKLRFGKLALGLGAAIGVLAVSSAMSASGSSATDTCIRAFVAQELPQGHPVRVVKREMSDIYWNHQPAKQVLVKAKGKRTGKSYGSATCYLDRDGGLVAMRVEGERIRVAQSSAIDAQSGG